MKKILILLAAAIAFCASAHAQIVVDDTQAVLERAYSLEPSKDVKKEGRRLNKEGWQAPAGSRSIEKQMAAARALEEEYLPDGDEVTGLRFIKASGQGKGKSYNMAQSMARAMAQSSIAGMIETQISSLTEMKMANRNENGEVTTDEDFRQTLVSMVNQNLTHLIPVMEIYRRLPDNSYEVQITLVYDKALLAKAVRSLD